MPQRLLLLTHVELAYNDDFFAGFQDAVVHAGSSGEYDRVVHLYSDEDYPDMCKWLEPIVQEQWWFPPHLDPKFNEEYEDSLVAAHEGMHAFVPHQLRERDWSDWEIDIAGGYASCCLLLLEYTLRHLEMPYSVRHDMVYREFGAAPNDDKLFECGAS